MIVSLYCMVFKCPAQWIILIAKIHYCLPCALLLTRLLLIEASVGSIIIIIISHHFMLQMSTLKHREVKLFAPNQRAGQWLLWALKSLYSKPAHLAIRPYCLHLVWLKTLYLLHLLKCFQFIQTLRVCLSTKLFQGGLWGLSLLPAALSPLLEYSCLPESLTFRAE